MAEYTTHKNMREWPYGLLDDLYSSGCPYRPEEVPEELPADLEASLCYAISTLTDRTKEIVYERYVERLSYKDIGKRHGVTQERIRQVIAKALRMLRHPSRFNFIRYGVSGAIIHARKEAAEKARERAVVEYLASVKLEDLEKHKALGQKNIYSTRLEELNLGVRAYNCLRRSGNETVGDVMRYRADELRSVRNLGRKSYHEIIDVFESIGVNCSKFKEDSDV